MNALEPTVRSCCGGSRDTPQALPPVDGRFSLIDHAGRPVCEGDFGDRHLLLFFGFVHCEAICPRELAKITRALEHLGPLADRIQPLFVTLDPERDTAEALRQHLGAHASRFRGLTGSPEAIAEVKRRFRVFSRKVVDPEAPGGYVLPHTAFAYLLAPGGGYRAHYSDALTAAELAERLRAELG